MNHFLIFIILLIFLYEFIRRIKYINNEDSTEFFESDEYKKTYLPYNFSDESFRKIDVPDYIKDIKIETSINEVVPATYPDELDIFFTGLDPKLFNSERPNWTKCQRPWIECYTNLEPVLEQRKRSEKDLSERMNSFNLLY